jgi:DNA-binding NtrC family response regulator
MPSILLIDDEETITLSLRALFEDKGYNFINSYTGGGGLGVALRELPDIVLLDLYLPDIHGLEVLKKLKSAQSDIAVIVMTGHAEIKDAVNAIKLGAQHYFQKPVDLDELSIMVEKNLSFVKLRQEAALCRESPYPIVGKSADAQKLMRIISLMADNPSTTILIEGETGTGKELVARNIHSLSARRENPFVDINCASIPENIFESELFGYEAGAFTDAKSTKRGLLEIADGGTLFLDEVAEMPLPSQAKLLRVIETKTFRRVGGTREIKVDIRVIAATNKIILKSLKDGTFREDLYYRLSVMPLALPPLRERSEDIPMLANFFISEISRSMNKPPKELAEDALSALCAYPWPGNIRELKNVIERALLLCPGNAIAPHDLTLSNIHLKENPSAPLTIEEVEKEHIRKILSSVEGNRTKAARILGISRSTLGEKIKKYNLD